MKSEMVHEFLLAHGRPAVAAQPKFSKRDRSTALNLSSNELLHPDLAELFMDFANNLHRYVNPARYPIFDRYSTRLCQAVGLPEGSCVLSPGSDPAIRVLMEAFTKTGKVIALVPCYRACIDYASVFGANFVAVEYRPEDSAGSRLLDSVRCWSPALVVLTNPDGITGRLWPLEYVSTLAEEAARHGSLLIIDSAYSAFAPIDHAPLVATHENVVVMRTYSKSHGAAGLRIAAVFAQPMYVEQLLKTRVSNGVSSVSLAYLDFIQENDEKFERIIHDIVRWRADCEDRIREARPDFFVPRSSANFVFMGIPSADRVRALERILGKAGVAVRTVAFGTAEPTSVRMTITEPRLLEPAMAILTER